MPAADTLTRRALHILRESPEAVDDARRNAPRGNSIAGAALALSTGSPRQYAEAAIVRALAALDGRGRFELGRIVTTPGALRAVGHPFIGECLARHHAGDWGDIGADDRAANEAALRDGGRLLSAYTAPDGSRLWLLTEADRSSTCALLPSEY
jgi:hypothetical protein